MIAFWKFGSYLVASRASSEARAIVRTAFAKSVSPGSSFVDTMAMSVSSSVVELLGIRLDATSDGRNLRNVNIGCQKSHLNKANAQR
ncbi:unnamed protein product [Schistosoma margrebowiei]|uniref:Uncharacterized protein n=1 Tax=Schistosoma margrebowiei TaxID=48269 RepID=A0A183MUS2_9TREM|nr:unnamed protein product [Schistosoma margrebowiei]